MSLYRIHIGCFVIKTESTFLKILQLALFSMVKVMNESVDIVLKLYCWLSWSFIPEAWAIYIFAFLMQTSYASLESLNSRTFLLTFYTASKTLSLFFPLSLSISLPLCLSLPSSICFPSWLLEVVNNLLQSTKTHMHIYRASSSIWLTCKFL